MARFKLEELRTESRILFPTIQGPDVIPWNQALSQLQAMLKAQKLETTATDLTASVTTKPNPEGDGVIGAPVRAPKTVTKKQLESILLLSPGYMKVEVGELAEPVKHDGQKLSLVIALEHTAQTYDKLDKPEGVGTLWEIFGIEKNGTAHRFGTQT